MNTKLLKQRILDLAIHGRLVPQNPDDEPISLPPLSEQTRIVSKIEEVFALLDEIERELA